MDILKGTNNQNLQLYTEPEQLIYAFHVLSEQWNDSYADIYSRALHHSGIYYTDDAENEALNLGRCLNKEYLLPFIIGENAFSSFDSLQEAISNYKKEFSQPGIFVLGSGNTALPLILNIIIGIILGHHIYFRSSSGNREALQVWLSSLNDKAFKNDDQLCNLHNKIKNAITEISLPYDDPAYEKTIGQLPVQKAYLWGGGEAIKNTVRILPEITTSYLLGPRTGVLVLDCDWWEEQSPFDKKNISAAIYENIIAFDSALCSSPTRGLIIGSADNAEKMVAEIISNIIPAEDEKSRFSRTNVQSSNNYRITMTGWRKFGYSILSPHNSHVKFSLGTIESFNKKNRFCVSHHDYHSSNGSLELISFPVEKLKDVAKMITYLQQEQHYEGLWSVGHIITAARPLLIKKIIQEIKDIQNTDQAIKDSKYILNADDLRIVDIRENIGRKPGSTFDGISLGPSMLL
ncbi:MAG: hypothetical protein JXJ04_26620 [Spirochaetales bacterium]|nr:hypothetical protein [Spirochaetales bacterium]